MKKIRIFKAIFWVTYALILGFGSYYIYRLIMIADELKQVYIDTYSESFAQTKLVFQHQKYRVAEIMSDRFDYSLMALMIFFMFVMLFIFVYYFLFKCLYFFYFCNEETLAVVEPEMYRYYLAFKDKDGNLYTDASPERQKLYSKIYKLRDGEIELFYDKRKPKNYIIGNKPVFLRDEFIKPFFTDLLIFGCVFALCLFFHPFLFLSVI